MTCMCHARSLEIINLQTIAFRIDGKQRATSGFTDLVIIVGNSPRSAKHTMTMTLKTYSSPEYHQICCLLSIKLHKSVVMQPAFC